MEGEETVDEKNIVFTKRKRELKNYKEEESSLEGEPPLKRQKTECSDKLDHTNDITLTKEWVVNLKRNILGKRPDDTDIFESRISTILPGIMFLSGDSYTAKELKELKVKTVLNLAKEVTPMRIRGITNHHFQFKDVCEEDISYKFGELHGLIKKSEKPILVHCQMGISRSATVVLAYLMKENKWNFSEAFEFVLRRRKKVSPNPGFVQQLLRYENILQGEDLKNMALDFKVDKSKKEEDDIYTPSEMSQERANEEM